VNDFQALLAGACALALAGGVHCAAMCGGFVGALHLHRPRAIAASHFAAAYHLGRVTSYATAGLLAGGIGGALYAADVLPVQIGLLALASVALLVIGGVLLAGSRPSAARMLRRLEPLGAGLLWRLVQPLARRVFPPRSTRAALVAGLAWGWIPCGMVYAALPLALVAGDAPHGAAVMVAFGASTLPNLVLIDLAAAGAMRRVLRGVAATWLRGLAGLAILAFGVSDLAYAVRLAGLDSPAVAMVASICHH
jgi:sulfite exporter TauE/SafE